MTAKRKTAPKKTAAPRSSTKTAPRAEPAPQPEPSRPAPRPAPQGSGTLNVIVLALAAFLGWVLLAPHPGQHTAQTPAAVLGADRA